MVGVTSRGEALGDRGLEEIDRQAERLMQFLPGRPADIAVDPRGDQDGLPIRPNVLLRPLPLGGIGPVEDQEAG